MHIPHMLNTRYTRGGSQPSWGVVWMKGGNLHLYLFIAAVLLILPVISGCEALSQAPDLRSTDHHRVYPIDNPVGQDTYRGSDRRWLGCPLRN